MDKRNFSYRNRCFFNPSLTVYCFSCIFFPFGKSTVENNVLYRTIFICCQIFHCTKFKQRNIKHEVIHFIGFFPDIIFHMRYCDVRNVRSTKQIEQSETRPCTTEKKCLKKQCFFNWFLQDFFLFYS